ncbi:MAG: Gfo/Idh/MocA family oxidoreductase [Deltaproteobacteria bacterium]|nr:Gfo/Idh/MocA family oxidoreductase [Deltaproteobacteria bacterium]
MTKQTSKKIPCVAVIGSGYWGKNLIRNFNQLGALKFICDKNESLLDQFQDQYPDVEVCLAFSDILRRKDIPAVVIATPAESHFALAREALLAGKHVFVEKPLALDLEEGAELVELADEKGLTLMVGHILQYHPAIIKLKELIDTGELGKIQTLYSNRLNIGKIRAEENILWSFAPHDISVILMLLGEMPEMVYASAGSYLQQRIPDTTLTILDFPDGVKAHIFVSWLHPFKEQKLVVIGDKKMAVFDDISEEKLFLYPHEIKWVKRIPVASKAAAEIVSFEMTEPLRAECKHFLESAAQGKRPKTDGEEGLRVLQVLQASQASLDQNSCIISLRQSPIMDASQSKNQTKGLKAEKAPFFAHESVYIDDDALIGDGSKIWHFSHILSRSSIGKNCNIGQNVVIGPDVTVGDNCKIQNNVSIYKGVTLEDGVFCGPSMVFTNVYNPRAEIRKMDQLRPTLVKKGATIGANATIICGITIGRYAFIGAGAVVTKNIPDHALMVGNPATQIGWACECGERLTDKLECPSCGKKYQKTGDGLMVID